jgi:uncharacterized protein (DUF1330 family)
MPKAYWITCYRSITDPEKLAAYVKLAAVAGKEFGVKFLARDIAAVVYEAGVKQRTSITVFDSLAQAVACHESPGYQAALKALGDGAERDVRIVEGME